jgi:hypothetical protein
VPDYPFPDQVNQSYEIAEIEEVKKIKELYDN